MSRVTGSAATGAVVTQETLGATATAVSGQLDRNTANNVGAQATLVVAEETGVAELSSSKQVRVTSVSPGSTGPFTVVVQNKGVSARSSSANKEVTDALPAAQLTLGAFRTVAGAGACAFTGSGSQFTCTGANFAPGVGSTVQVTAGFTVRSGASGPTKAGAKTRNRSRL